MRLGFLFFFLSAFDLKSGFFENEFVITGVSLELQLEFFGLLDIRSFFEADLPVGHNDDGRFSEDRTSLLAKPATVALRCNDDRAAIPLDRTKNDGIVWTDLITDQTDLVLSPDQAHLLAQDGGSHFGMILLLNGDGADGLGGANLAADIAILVAGS